MAKNLEQSIKVVRQRANDLAIDNLKKRLQSPRLRAQGTIKIYIQTGKIFMNWLPHSPPATSADFRAFFTWRRENNISERSLRTEYFQIKKLAEANDWPWDFIKEDTPVSKTKAFAPSHSIDDIKKIIASRDLLTKAERFYLACSTTWGCRREELSKIIKRDYNTEVFTIHIAKRGVDMDHVIPDVLKPVFEAYHPDGIRTESLSEMYHRICEKTGVPHPAGWGWHSIRRMVETALAQSLAANGLQESWSSSYIGWSQESTGRKYLNSAMAGHYTHTSETTVDPWWQEKLIISAHPFLHLWGAVPEKKESKVVPEFF